MSFIKVEPVPKIYQIGLGDDLRSAIFDLVIDEKTLEDYDILFDSFGLSILLGFVGDCTELEAAELNKAICANTAIDSDTKVDLKLSATGYSEKILSIGILSAKLESFVALLAERYTFFTPARPLCAEFARATLPLLRRLAKDIKE
jgi:hypothetical protein